MDTSLRTLAIVVFPVLAMVHLSVSPFTKVEESFNMQAIHDILEYGVPTSDVAQKFKTLFDHMTFPGAVPRTFIGSLLLSGSAKPYIWFGGLVGRLAQFHVRGVLGGMNAVALVFFGSEVEKAFGPIVASWYLLLQASQFHIWYYASRTLPNMFAFFFSTIALACLLPNPTSSMGPVKRTRLGLYLLTIATVIFRSELAILLAAHCAWLFLKPETFEAKVLLVRNTFIPAIIPGALVALLLTVAIDTYFWQSSSYLWPELSAFLSNVFPSSNSLGASAWGTQPWYWYLAIALPRLLMNQIFMVGILFAFPQALLDARILDSLVPSYAYVMMYSFLPHKETRFMFPIVPSLTLVAAISCTQLTINMRGNFMVKLLFYAAVASTLITAFISHVILLPLSALNYPGGHALEELHNWYYWNYQTIAPLHNDDPSHPQIHVHITNLALQSGVTRFLEQPPRREDAEDVFTNTPGQSSVMGSHNSDPNDQKDPIILPGDGNHPALTIYPKSATPSEVPAHPSERSYANPTWIYDKSPSTNITDAAFWSNFDFLIIESPANLSPPLAGPWQSLTTITSLSSRPVILPPPTPSPSGSLHNARRYNPPYTSTLAEHLEYWISWQYLEHVPWTTEEFEAIPYESGRGGTTWVIYEMYPTWLAVPLTRIHDLLHDILRLDLGITRGRWIEIPLVTRLHVLRNCAAGGAGCEAAVMHPVADESKQARLADESVDNDSEDEKEDEPSLIDAPSGDTNQQPMVNDWDALGPLVVNKDGTLSRLENWGQMNAQERKKTVDYLRKRNMLRIEGVGEAVM